MKLRSCDCAQTSPLIKLKKNYSYGNGVWNVDQKKVSFLSATQNKSTGEACLHIITIYNKAKTYFINAHWHNTLLRNDDKMFRRWSTFICDWDLQLLPRTGSRDAVLASVSFTPSSWPDSEDSWRFFSSADCVRSSVRGGDPRTSVHTLTAQ